MRKRSLASARRRRLAPRHPKAPEAKIRLANARLLKPFHDDIVDTVMEYARHRTGAQAAQAPHMPSVFKALRHKGKQEILHGPYMGTVKAASKATAKSVNHQVGRALGRKTNADLDDEIGELADRLYDTSDNLITESVDRAEAIYDAWDEEDEQELKDDLESSLEGVLGTSLALASLAFGDAFGEMNREAQTQEGVSGYEWIAQHDSATRPEHLALDGETAPWSEPLLKAEDSTSGEECYPGDDWNCRCVASPLNDDESDLLN